jgi:hypothetical protein
MLVEHELTLLEDITWIIIASHWILAIRVPGTAQIITIAVMNVTPDLVREIVPGSASLYATNICRHFSDGPKRSYDTGTH